VELRRLDPDDPRPRFSCGDPELDEFYAVDSVVGSRELLSVTYAFQDGHGDVAAFFCVSNDAIKKELLPRSSFRRLVRVVPHDKRYSSMPAVKIGRLGVSISFYRRNGFEFLTSSDEADSTRIMYFDLITFRL
jgi:hypothetical protein